MVKFVLNTGHKTRNLYSAIADSGIKIVWKEWNQKEQEDPEWGKEHPLVFNVSTVDGELQVEAGCR